LKKFSLDKAIEKVEIDGEVFEIDLSDNKRKEYQLEGYKLQKKAQEFEKLSDDLTEEQQQKALDDIKEVTKNVTDKVLGEGAFDKLYPKTNYSIVVIADVLFQVIDYVREKEKERFEQKKAKYIKKKKR